MTFGGELETFFGDDVQTDEAEIANIFFDEIGNIVYYADTTTSAVGNRINRILNEIGWPSGNREIFTGNVPIKRTVYAPRSSAMLMALPPT